MVTRNEAFPSKYLKHEDLGGEPMTVTIKSAAFETMKGLDGEDKQKVVLQFNLGKPFVLNMTNYDAVADALGTDETDNWIGGKVELYPTTTPMGGKIVDCIRIRKPGAADKTKPKKVTPLRADPGSS